jgi:sugar (pentulose or hexulose) kinase
VTTVDAVRDGHVLAVDIGTSVVRVSAVSPTGAVAASSWIGARTKADGVEVVLDAERLWSDVCMLVSRVVGEVGQPCAVGVAAQLGTVLVDEALDPVERALLWPDRRAAAEASGLADTLGDRAGSIAGRAVAPELTAPRMLWVTRHCPDAWAETKWILSLKDFVVARLTRRTTTDPTSASYTLLFDVSRGEWSRELLAAAGVPAERMPAVLPADERCGAVDEGAAGATGLDPGLPVVVGGPDGTAGALGSGAGRAGVTVDVAGTTDVLLHTTARPIADPHRRSILNAYLLPGLWTVGGPTGMTGGAIAWLCGLLGYESVERAYRELGPAVTAIEPGAGGITFHTALTGDRFPTWSGSGAGSLSGLRPDHTAAHLLRAAEEGAAFTVRRGLDVLAELGVGAGEIRVAGGSSKREEAMQLRANVWHRPVVSVSRHEATTIGAAILAARCGGLHASIADAVEAMVALEDPIEPEPALADAYDEAYERWLAVAG